VLPDMAPPPYLKCVKVFESNTLSLDFGCKTSELNVAVRPKPDWFVAELIIVGGVKGWDGRGVDQFE
jgi:hypothetical protein